MIELTAILTTFFEQQDISSLIETPDFLSLHASCKQPKKNIKSSLSSLFSCTAYVDLWQVTIENGDEPFTFDSAEEASSTDFIKKWEELVSNIDDEDECKLSITIEKKVHNKHFILIYDFNSFFSYLSTLKVHQCITVVSSLVKKCEGRVVFIGKGFPQQASTNTLHFISELPFINPVHANEFSHQKTWERIKSISQFSGLDECLALPSDFKIETAGSLPNEIIEKFNQCCLALLLAVVFDITNIKEDILTGKLNGYKTFSATFDIDKLKKSSINTYYDVYMWILTGGNLQDKVGLARNLISLHIDPSDNYSLPDSVYYAILSGYRIYERQNIKQYIELRNKMSDQIMNFTEKAGKIVETFASSFQKSALAVVSLYASVIVVRVLSSKNVLSAFSIEATLLSLVFLLISLVYFFICRWEVRQQLQRFSESYTNMKKRNEDLLTKEDIVKILNNDREYKADLAFIKGKQKRYTFLWISLLGLLALTTLLLFYIHQLQSRQAII